MTRVDSVGHPGLPVPQTISCYEMEHLSILLATEYMRQQYTQKVQTYTMNEMTFEYGPPEKKPKFGYRLKNITPGSEFNKEIYLTDL